MVPLMIVLLNVKLLLKGYGGKPHRKVVKVLDVRLEWHASQEMIAVL